MHFLLFSNVNKDPDQKVTERLERLILDRGHTVTKVMEGDEAPEEGIPLDTLAPIDVVIVLGGDGTMLRASHAIGAGEVPSPPAKPSAAPSSSTAASAMPTSIGAWVVSVARNTSKAVPPTSAPGTRNSSSA